MKHLNTDVLRRATGGAQLASANDLVRRTLAQHGLMAPDATGPAHRPMPAFSDLLARNGAAAAAPAALVPGATFTAARFTCDAGSRDYLTYVPATASEGLQGLVLMLHGCTQTHADFATGTGMNALAEQHRLVIVYPQQSRGDNAQSCWNWFSRGDQRRGRGEPAILAELASHVAGTHGVGPAQTYVAGLSAGAAMSVILGRCYGDVFAAVGAHSGLPCGAAQDVASAFAAMAGNATASPGSGDSGHATPTIVFHGTADHTVNPLNGERIARDILDEGPAQTLARKERGEANGRAFTRDITTTLGGEPRLEHWIVEGLGHAWSGGQPGGSYTDPAGPDASAEMVRFFLDRSAKAV